MISLCFCSHLSERLILFAVPERWLLLHIGFVLFFRVMNHVSEWYAHNAQSFMVYCIDLTMCPFDYTAFAVSWKVGYQYTGLTTPVG